MKYLKRIGINSKKAFEHLSNVNHKLIASVLEDYNKNIQKNKTRLIRENIKDIKNVKRKHLVDRLILNDYRMNYHQDIYLLVDVFQTDYKILGSSLEQMGSYLNLKVSL